MLGLKQLAAFTIDDVTLPDLVSQTVTWPVSVNVVPGDDATGRVADPTVTTARPQRQDPARPSPWQARRLTSQTALAARPIGSGGSVREGGRRPSRDGV